MRSLLSSISSTIIWLKKPTFSSSQESYNKRYRETIIMYLFDPSLLQFPKKQKSWNQKTLTVGIKSRLSHCYPSTPQILISTKNGPHGCIESDGEIKALIFLWFLISWVEFFFISNKTWSSFPKNNTTTTDQLTHYLNTFSYAQLYPTPRDLVNQMKILFYNLIKALKQYFMLSFFFFAFSLIFS